jgi:hypothetical protein
MAATMPRDDRSQARIQQADSRKALRTSRAMIRNSEGAMNASRAAMRRLPPSRGGADHPPVILQLGPREFSVLTWTRDENGASVYRVVKDKIKAASVAALLAGKLQQK